MRERERERVYKRLSESMSKIEREREIRRERRG